MSLRQRALFAGVALFTLTALAWLGQRWRGEQERRQWAARVPGAAPLCVEASRIFCERLQSCGGLERAQFLDCVEHHARDCQEDIGWRIQAGVRILRPQAQEECLEAMGEASCNAIAFVLGDDEQDIFESTSECDMDEMLVPDGGLGSACALSSDCVAGSCMRSRSGPARCTPQARVGDPCGPFLPECDPDAGYCGAAEGDTRCLALKADGVPCVDLRECAGGICRGVGARACGRGAGGPCLDPRDCGASEYCRPPSHGGRCAPRVRSGDPCDWIDEQVCQEAEAACVLGRCAVRAMSVREDGLCRDFTDCRPGLYCRWDIDAGAGGACLPQGEAGDGCRAGDFGSCRLGARCQDGVCRHAASQGQSCRGPSGCQGELSCAALPGDAGSTGGGRCLPLAAAGEACGPTRSCRQGLMCRTTPWGGVCVAPGADRGS